MSSKKKNPHPKVRIFLKEPLRLVTLEEGLTGAVFEFFIHTGDEDTVVE